jgi:monofunctional biosynthetic peptidoglycan transglycosylase
VDTVELKIVLNEARNKKHNNPRGASTISQQLAKNLFLWNGRSYSRKIIEAGLALSIEITWPKKRILEVYMNVVQFSDAVYGAKEASRKLFDKPAIDLTKEEAALLAAVLPRPSASNVNDPSPELVKKQQWILKQMKQLGGLNYLKKL